MEKDSRLPRLFREFRELRKMLGSLSLEQLAHRFGVPWSTVNRWENDKGTPSPIARKKLATALIESGMARRLKELS
jgi:DNA-binding transcriptional regulator YiaG